MTNTLRTISDAGLRAAPDGRRRVAWLPDRLSAYRGRWRDEEGRLRLPLGLTVPAMVAFSLGLWAGIVLAVELLF